jgi:hypothetical protein
MDAINLAQESLLVASSTQNTVQAVPEVASTTPTATPLISANASSTCPPSDGYAVNGPPDPCNPYAFKLSECPPETGKPLGPVYAAGYPLGVPSPAVQEQRQLIGEYCPTSNY